MDAVRKWPAGRAAAGWWRRRPHPRAVPAAEWRHRPAARALPAADAPATTEPSAFAFGALVVFTFILLTAPQNIVPALAPLRIALMAAVVSIGAHLWHCLSHRRPLRPGLELQITLALIAWAALTVPFSSWPSGSLAFLLTVYLKTVAIFWLLGELVTTLPRLRLIVWTLALLSLPLAVTGVRNFLAGAFLSDAIQIRRIVGFDAPLTENPNDLALVLNLILPLTIALLLGARSVLPRVVLLGVVGLNAAGVIATFSRAGFLTLVAILAAYFWKLRKHPAARWRWAAVGIALACLPLLPAGYSSRLETITDIEADDTGSAKARWIDTLAAARYMVGHPVVGAGIGMNTLVLNEMRGATWRAVHNAYLEYGVELGVLGVALFVALLVMALRKASIIERRAAERAPELVHLAGGIQVSLLAFALAAFFHPNGYQFPFYYMAGLAVALPAVYDAEVARSPERPR